MQATGIIVEYNPFHNGHLYHLHETKKLTDADVVIAVMSGNFLQRGEPALLPKAERTKMALAAGVDLVIELPYAFSTQQADIFANGSVSLLHALGVQDICFGSESGSIEDFYTLLEKKKTHQHDLQHIIKTKMKEGVSYPKALSYALEQLSSEGVNVSLPNNILGMHYIEAIKDQQSPIIPRTIQRHGSNYHDETFEQNIASATSVRKTLLTQDLSLSSIQQVIPSTTTNILEAYITSYKVVHHWEQYFPLLKYALLTKTKEELATIYEAEEGLENRLLAHIAQATSFTTFMETIKTKRYTWTRLQRLCLHILTNTTKEQMASAYTDKTVPYIRLLGMNQQGQRYLSFMKKKIELPLLANTKAFSHPLLELENKASAVYTSILPEPLRSEALKRELTLRPIRYNETEKAFSL
jgi:predicted nucleotidyltransferase